MKKTLKTFAVKLLIFAAVMVLVDQGVGLAYDLVRSKISNYRPNNLNQKTFFTVEKVDTDVVIIGASDASHHYIPQLLSDSLNMSIYNCGQDGCFFLYQNCLINLMLERYSPKVIIWEMMEDCLSTNMDGRFEYQSISGLYPYYKDSYCREVIDSKDKTQKYLMYSQMFRNNSKAFDIVYNIIRKHNFDRGYVPIENTGYKYPALSHEQFVQNINEKKVKRLESTIENCKNHGVKLIFASSPRYADSYLQSTIQYKKLKEIVAKHDVPFIDSYNNYAAYQDSTLFKDNNHLNDRGARVYMQWFIPQLKSELAVR